MLPAFAHDSNTNSPCEGFPGACRISKDKVLGRGFGTSLQQERSPEISRAANWKWQEKYFQSYVYSFGRLWSNQHV